MPTVVCLSNNNNGLALTVNREYQAEEGDTCFQLTNDLGESKNYLKSHFRVVNSAPTAPSTTPANIPTPVSAPAPAPSTPTPAPASNSPATTAPVVAVINGNIANTVIASNMDNMLTLLRNGVANGQYHHDDRIAVYTYTGNRISKYRVVANPSLVADNA